MGMIVLWSICCTCWPLTLVGLSHIWSPKGAAGASKLTCLVQLGLVLLIILLMQFELIEIKSRCRSVLTHQIDTKFCTCHDSTAVVACANFCGDWFLSCQFEAELPRCLMLILWLLTITFPWCPRLRYCECCHCLKPRNVLRLKTIHYMPFAILVWTGLLTAGHRDVVLDGCLGNQLVPDWVQAGALSGVSTVESEGSSAEPTVRVPAEVGIREMIPHEVGIMISCGTSCPMPTQCTPLKSASGRWFHMKLAS